MSGSDRQGEARETQRPSLKVSMPRSVPSVPGQSSGIDSTTDTPIVSNTEDSSPNEEDDHDTSQLHINTTKEVASEGTDFNPLTAGLDTGGLGRKFWEEEAFANLDFLDPQFPPENDAVTHFENHYAEAEVAFDAAPGSEEEGPVYDFGSFPEEPALPTNLDANLPPPCETPHHMSNDAPTSTYPYSNAGLRATTPAFDGRSSGNTHVSVSSPRYSNNALRPHLAGATEIIQGTDLSQHQAPYYTRPSHQNLSQDVRADRSFAAANVDVGGYSNAHLRAFSDQQMGMPKRRSISDASIFLQHEHQSRNRMPHTLTNTPNTRDRRQSGLRTSALNETTNQGYQEQPYAYGYSFSGHGINDATPEVHAHYGHTRLGDHVEYPSRGWQRGEQEQYTSGHAQQNFNDAVDQGGLYAGTTELLPSPFRPEDLSQARDAPQLPQPHVSQARTLFGSIEEAKDWRTRHLVDSNKHDPTIPRTPAQQQQVVRRLVQAINDTDEAMASSYVKYFTDQKYSPEHIESTCWMVLDACITRHLKGPLQTEDERAPFKAKVADYNTCAERIEVVIRAFRTQKSICKQLMEPYHLYQFIDDPLAKIKRTENNKALNDRKAEQIAAGKAFRGDDNRARTRRGKQKSHDEEGPDDSQGVADALTGLNAATQHLRAASSMSASTRSTPAPSAVTSSRKRTRESETPGIDPSLQDDYSGPPSKKARIGPASSSKALNFGQSQQSYQPPSLGNFTAQPHGTDLGQNQRFAQLNASNYGNPSTGGIQGSPYFTQRPIAPRRPGQAYPEIEGYHTPSVGFGITSAYNEGNTVGHDTGHGQHPTRALHQNIATSHAAIPSGPNLLPAYTTSNPYSHSQQSTRGQRKRQADFEDDGSDFEASQSNRKKRRNA